MEVGNKMEYTINGMIKLSPISKLRLSSKVDFISPSKANVSLSSESDDKLSVSIKLEADNDTTAQELAQLELSRICNRLSFHNNIGISKSRVTGMSYTSISSKGNTDVAAIVTVRLKATANVVVTLGNKSLAKLTSNLEQDYSPDFEEVIFRWREAISNEASALRYFLLYRLLEFLFNSDTKKLTSWIISKEPQVQIVSDRKRGDTTIYTSLRDHIHPKEKTFPIQQIQETVSKLQTLVQQKFKEKFNIQ